MGRSEWGPPIWKLFHTFAEKVKEEDFNNIKQQLISFIIQICNVLPCPYCAQHAKLFWKNTKLDTIITKSDLQKVLFVFHNSVNKRTLKLTFNYENLNATYNNKNLINEYNHFCSKFNTNGNMTLLSDSFHRKRLLNSLKIWLIANINCFER